jgi:hypothetical protein
MMVRAGYARLGALRVAPVIHGPFVPFVCFVVNPFLRAHAKLGHGTTGRSG